MSGLLYYISGLRAKPTDAELKDVGLDGQKVGGICPTEIFLDNTQGIVFSIKGRYSGDLKIGFYHDEQTWTNIPNADGKKGKLWIGYYKNDKPKPKDFLRKDYIEGYFLELADRNEWIIPIARRFQQGCLLPKGIGMLVADRIDEFVIQKYIPLQKIAEQLYVHFGLDSDEEFKKDDDFLCDNKSFFKVCVDVLSTNYNLDFREITILKLFTTDNTIELLKLVVDMPYIDKLIANSRSIEKKKELVDTSIL